MPIGHLKRSNNSTGGNQHRKRPILEDHPELPQLLQSYIDTNVKQKDIPKMLQDEHLIDISLCSVQLIMKEHHTKTVRHNGLDDVEQGVAILKEAEDDPLGRWGGRLMKDKLSGKTIHIARDFIMTFRRLENPESTAGRHPRTRKVHHHGLHSSGPNEEWCVDGHEKILNSMGIAIWGVIDKYSHMELGLWAVPNARLADVPPALFLCLVRQIGGIPVTTTSDKGSELGKFIPLVTTLRQTYQPYLSEDILPTHKAVKSVFNITCERGWRPIWEKELGNIAFEYTSGKALVGFYHEDPIHEGVARWLWAQIVQLRLDKILTESQTHRVRKQAGSLLPTGGRRLDFYTRPEDWGGENLLIPVPREDIDNLLAAYDKPELLQFGSDNMVKFCETVFHAIGSPKLDAKDGWKIFTSMINLAADSENIPT